MSGLANSVFELDKDGKTRRGLTIRNNDKGKQGASGTVYELPAEPGQAIKVYHEKERPKFENKIRAMIKVKYNRPHADQFDFAWPEAVVVDKSGGFIGFKMPFFGANWVDLESLMQASEAESRYGIGERERLAIVINLALAIKQLHALCIYCIDLKPQNIRVNLEKSSVGVIDCDGMSVIDIGASNGKRFYADKSTPEFWAPENIGIKPHQFADEEAHDRFALATIIFMLLNRGIHPYQGVLNSEIPGAETTAGKIKHNLYPYGAGKGKITPHEKSLYQYWPEELENLFDGAFSGPGQRPSSDEWHIYFNLLNSQAEPCNKHPKYHVKLPFVGCPVCTRDAAISNASPAPTTFVTDVWAYIGARTASPTTQFQTGTPAPIQPAYTPPQPPLSLPLPSRPPSGPGMAIVVIGLALIGVVALFMNLRPTGSSTVVTLPPVIAQPPPRPQRRCAQQSVFEQAVRGGASTLRGYLRECLVGDPYIQQARNALEPLAYNDALTCIRSSCDFERCFLMYTTDFQFGGRFSNALNSEATQARNSPRCTPARGAPRGRIICPHPGAPMIWTCDVGQRCGSGGGCIGQSRPLGRPVDIGRPVIIGR